MVNTDNARYVGGKIQVNGVHDGPSSTEDDDDDDDDESAASNHHLQVQA